VVRRANGGGERNPVEAVGVEMLRERRWREGSEDERGGDGWGCGTLL
jgi:hypothetical protein